MQKPISAVDIIQAEKANTHVVVITLDGHLTAAASRVRTKLAQDIPNISFTLHAASEWKDHPDKLEVCRNDIAIGDIIIVTMMFMEDHIQAVLPDLQARRDSCDAMIACMSAGEVIKLTRMGRFNMGAKESGAIAMLKRLRGSKKKQQSSGSKQMAMLRRLPRLLRFIPGTAQDVRAYFLVMQYWIACSDQNLENMVRLLVDRYADKERCALPKKIKVDTPIDYPDVGVYHPKLAQRLDGSKDALCRDIHRKDAKGTIGLILMRSYILSRDTGHYDGVINAFEAQDFNVVPIFASGLDARPAIEKFFLENDTNCVDAVVSLTGFSLVGGPAYNNAQAAEDILAKLDVPYVAAHALEFQNLEQWAQSDQGLSPIEATMMIAIPELDGATGPIVYGGRSSTVTDHGTRAMCADIERTHMLVERVAKRVALRKSDLADRKVAIVLFNFPPNSGAIGTAAHLAVFESLFSTLKAMKAKGYSLDIPESVEALQDALIHGNAAQYGTDANVHVQISADDHVRNETWLDDIEAQWGPAPGRHQSNGSTIFVLGKQFGNIFVGLQPSFGYEGDPMRLLFEKGFAPTHAFSAFYRYINQGFGAHAVLHFGTHGALEFMPGKQTGLNHTCWPDRLISDLPNYYLYAANNPSEGTIAKRRSAATLISYLTPPVTQAGLYKGLLDLKTSLDRWRNLPCGALNEKDQLASVIQSQAAEIDLAMPEPEWNGDADAHIAKLTDQILELEYALIPHGLHVIGQAPTNEERIDLLAAMTDASDGITLTKDTVKVLTEGHTTEDILQHADLENTPETQALVQRLQNTNQLLQKNEEVEALLHALDGGFTRPVPGGDVLRTPDILPTGRNLHGFDPFRIPSAFALKDGAQQAERLIERHISDGNAYPKSIALVLWGTDNLKSEGGPIAQALALIGAEPRFDSYGRLSGASLIPLEQLGRPRIDVVMTLSGIFRDLLPLQTKLLAEAAFLAASADEPEGMNFLKQNALAHQKAHDCDLETAALRVFSNADGAYGSNVNFLIDNGSWSDEDELATAFERRKSFAYGCDGKPVQREALLQSILKGVDLSYQNLESVELGVTTINHYFDTLGGIGRAVQRASGKAAPVYIGDQTRGEGKVRTLNEQVALETRSRMLNPKWYEGMLKHGYEGVRQIEEHITNIVGWSATTGQVDPWVYQRLTQTYVLDDEMRARLAQLNPKASAKVANRLLEAYERKYWSPDETTLQALNNASDELEDYLEGVTTEIAPPTPQLSQMAS